MLEDLLKDILKEENVLMSVNASGAVIEMRVNNNNDMPFRVRENWITIGDNNGPCHMHINKNEVKEVRFVKEKKETRTSYSIRLLNAKGERLVAAFFTKMSDQNGNPVKERVERYENIFKKYGSREVITLQSN
ncbi:MAG: ChuX/HutX family heme-like substrate-binding protein [Nitrososphaerales archaeon]